MEDLLPALQTHIFHCKAESKSLKTVCLRAGSDGRRPGPVSRVSYKLSITSVLLALRHVKLESQGLWIALLWMLLNYKSLLISYGNKAIPYKAILVLEKEGCFLHLSKELDLEIRSDVILFVVQGEEN